MEDAPLTEFEGTAVASYGHVWKEYGYDWSISFGLDGVGVEFDPLEQTRL